MKVSAAIVGMAITRHAILLAIPGRRPLVTRRSAMRRSAPRTRGLTDMHLERIIASCLLPCVCVLAIAGCTRRVSVASPVVPLRTEAIPVSGDLPSHRFGRLFCGVLPHTATATTPWGYCERYFAPSGTPSAFPPDINASRYRILVVPGIFGECVEALARPFEDARRHLMTVHKVDVEYVSVTALGSPAHNAQQIANYLQAQFAGSDKRPYIAVGYSKGANDLLETVASHEIGRTGIKALVTIAGAVLGSRLTEGVPRGLLDFFANSKLGTCSIGDGGGIDGLRRSSRADAAAKFRPPDGFRAYSIAAVSDAATTSAVLMNGWRQLTAYSQEHDSQVIHEDAIAPGATYLGIAKGDHWAVALPFDDVPPSHPAYKVIRQTIDHNTYPRVALLESALRFVLADLP